MQIVDSHVHFWDPAALPYPWLAGIPSLDRAYLPADYRAATGATPIGKIVFVEANCRPSETQREVELIVRLAEVDPRIAGIVAYADMVDTKGLRATLDTLVRSVRVKGIRHNIQGEAAGFCVQRAFVDGVREVGRRGLTFDLCVTPDQLREVVQLVRQCPDTRFVLDHCGKPAIRDGRPGRWREHVAGLAAHDNVVCKLSGLLTEAAPDGWTHEDLVPYAEWVTRCFGSERLMYGSDWPVLTLAGSYCDWYGFTQAFTQTWSAPERDRFYGGTAIRVYRL